MSEAPRKRSRFDQTEPEPKRASRFDRRSRSPPARKSEDKRDRSPLPRDSSTPDGGTASKADAAAAAAAVAAKISAQLAAKKGIQHVDVPPIRSTSTPLSADVADTNEKGEVYTQDGDYIKDIEINDLRNRYTLTKGATQKMIKEQTGADVTTRGEYYPDKSMASAANPPLYLHITSTTKEGLEKAIQMIEDMKKQELPNLVDERRFRRREPEQFERDEFGRRKWPEERIPIDLEPIPGFNLRAQVVGHGGSYVKHIQGETRCRVQIKGRGSGFIEQNTGRESDEPMYLHVAGPDPEMVKHAKSLCLDLLENVKQQYEQFKERGPQQRFGGGGGGGGDRDHYGNGQRQNSYGARDHGGYGGHQSPAQGGGGAGGAMSPTGAAAPGTPGQQDYSAQWAAYYAQQGQNPDQDPYAAYGGYQAYMQMYYQYYGQQAQQAGAAGAPGAASNGTVPPPPPSGNDAPPPPPPGTSDAAPPPPPPGAGSYNAVPPPPGM